MKHKIRRIRPYLVELEPDYDDNKANEAVRFVEAEGPKAAARLVAAALVPRDRRWAKLRVRALHSTADIATAPCRKYQICFGRHIEQIQNG